jgi:hypothetical protein
MFDLRSLEAADAALSSLAAAAPGARIRPPLGAQERGLELPKVAICPHLARPDGRRRPS